jgi:hypothetical protein
MVKQCLLENHPVMMLQEITRPIVGAASRVPTCGCRRIDRSRSPWRTSS